MLFKIICLFLAGSSVGKESKKVNVREILELNPEFTQVTFDKLLVRPDLPHLLLTDVDSLLGSIQADFPNQVQLTQIGKSWEGRPLKLLTLHLSDELAKSDQAPQVALQDNIETTSLLVQLADDGEAPSSELKSYSMANKGPSILHAGAHHSRELISTQMVLYQALKLLQDGVVHKKPEEEALLKEKVLHFLPVVNPDGLALIEQDFPNSNKVLPKRKNMNPDAAASLDKTACLPKDSGVDLNRNYPVDFGVQTMAGQGDELCNDPCAECYRGSEPFSEKETRALRDFIEMNKDSLKFVSNFHSNGNSWVYPYNGRKENDIEARSPGMLQIFQEISSRAKFPEGNQHDGNSQKIMGQQIGGDMDDWVLATYNIPSITCELGTESQYVDEWQAKSAAEAFDIVSSNSQWLSHVYKKMGSQVALKPKNYQQQKSSGGEKFLNSPKGQAGQKDASSLVQLAEQEQTLLPDEFMVQVNLTVQNQGLSEMTSAKTITLQNENMEIVSVTPQESESKSNTFSVDPLSSRKEQQYQLLVKIKDPPPGHQPGFYKDELAKGQEGVEMNFGFSEFGSSTEASGQSLVQKKSEEEHKVVFFSKLE